MSFDLGAVVARVIVEDAEFQRMITRDMGLMRDFGAQSGTAASGTAKLDQGLAAVATSASRASSALTRGAKSAADIAAADQKAAAAAERHAAAEDQLAIVMGDIAGMTAREQKAVLSLLAAHENLSRVEQSQTATLVGLARAQAAVIGADDRLTAAQNAAATAAEREAAAVRAAAVASSTAAAETGGLGLAMGGLIKTAGQLGLIIGGIEIGKKAIEFISAGRDLTTALNSVQAAAQATDAQMIPVRAQVIGLGKDLTVPRATAVDAAAAIDDLVRSGMTLPRAMAAARSALLLATVAQSDMALSSRVLGDALDEFRLPASQAAKVANMLGAAATSTAGGIETVFDALRYSGSRARAAQVPMSDLLASIVDLSKAGLQGTTIGTGLAMMITRLAAKTPATVSALHSLGIEAWDSQGRFKGLPYVIQAVSDAQKRFGPNSKAFLGALNAAFGARAANVMAAFAGKGIEGLNRFQARLGSFNLQTAANNMNRGLAAAFAQDRKELTALGIDVYTKLGPALTSAALWLGTSVPHALSVLAGILGPTVHTIGGAFVIAWHTALAVLGPVAGALGSIGHVLAENSGVVRDATGLVLGLWVAFKGYQGAVFAIAAVRTAMAAFRGEVVVGNASAAAFGTNMRALVAPSNLAAAGLLAFAVAVGVGGAKLNSWIESGRSGVAVMNSLGHNIDDWKASLDAVNGALTENVLRQVAVQLQANGLAGKAAAAGISLNELTAGVTGNRAAFDSLVTAWKAGGSPSADTINAAGLMNVAFNGVRGSAKKLAGVHIELAHAETKSASAADANIAAHKALPAPLQTVASTLHLTSDEVKTYAGMLGLAVTQSGDLASPTQANIASIAQLSHIMDGASASVADLTKAWTAFASSEGTAADRAALIGATLKAANGDALGYAASINATAVAEHQLATDMASAAKSVGKNGVSVAHLVASIVDLKTGTINYHNVAAAPLINDLQAIQTAAMGAAQATYQHARQTMNGKAAADAAYKVYVNQTRGALIGEASQLGLTSDQAKRLADRYFGMPGKVKTLIEAEGTDPILTVLNKIGALLAKVFGVPWVAKAKVDTSAALPAIKGVDNAWIHHAEHISRLWPALNADGTRAAGQMSSVHNQWVHYANTISAARAVLNANPTPAMTAADTVFGKLHMLNVARANATVGVNDYASGPLGHIASYLDFLNGRTATVTVNEQTVRSLGSTRRSQVPGGNAAGSGPGGLPQGWSTVGERGWEAAYTAGGKTQIFPHGVSMSMLGLPDRLPGFASGTSTDPLVTKTLYGPWGAGIQGVATMLRSQIPGATAAMADLSKAVDEAFQLKGVEREIASVTKQLATVTAYRNSVMSTVSSTFQSQQYGSVGDLLAGEKSDTANNNTIAAEIKKLTGEGLPMSYLSNLISQGQFTTLATLASANKGQIAQVAKAVNLDTSSLYNVGRAATLQKYGTTVGGLQGTLDNLTAERATMTANIDKLVAVVTQLTGRPAQITMDGHVVSEAVVHSDSMVRLIDDLGHHITYPRR